MKLLLSSLLLASLCALSSWSVSHAGKHVVTQNPEVSVMEGEAVNITCCWTLSTGDRITVTWKKNKTEIKTDTFYLKDSSQGDTLKKEACDCSNLSFVNVTREDSGRYICKVTWWIPLRTEVEGNGTVLTVTARDKTAENTAGDSISNHLLLPVIISMVLVASLLLITLLCFCNLRRRRAQAARVIYEVPHFDSEEVEVDKHSSSSSRGSSQWCQVPVYESFDYFERVQTKESG